MVINASLSEPNSKRAASTDARWLHLTTSSEFGPTSHLCIQIGRVAPRIEGKPYSQAAQSPLLPELDVGTATVNGIQMSGDVVVSGHEVHSVDLFES